MRNLRKPVNDSLDLLLDTLCNVFGSIILIACLLALISREPDTSPVSPVVDLKGAGLLLERRLEAARKEMENLQLMLDELQTHDQSGLRRLAAERDALRSTVERLRAERQEKAQTDNRRSITAMADPGLEISELRQKAKKEGERLADINSQLQAAQAKKEHASQRLKLLTSQIDENENMRIQQLRLPREKPKTKDSRPVLLKFGEIYPLTDVEGKPFPGLRRIQEADDAFNAHPKKTEGLFTARDAVQLRELFLHYKKTGGYLTLYVYPDSYATFRELKQIILETGVEYGLDACDEHEIIRFGKTGGSPAPL